MPSKNPPAPPKALSKHDLMLKRVKDGDRDVVFELPDNLRDDSEFMLQFLDALDETLITSSSYQLASQRLQNDYDFALKVVALKHYFYVGIPLQFKDDKKLLMIALKGSSKHYHNASSRLRNDLEICKELVSKDDPAYFMLPKIMQAHPEIISIAMHNPDNFAHFPESFKKQKANVLRVIQHYRFDQENISKCISPEFLQDENVVLALVEKMPIFYEKLHTEQKQNLNIILKTLESSGQWDADELLFSLAINIDLLSLKITGARSLVMPHEHEALIQKTKLLIHKQLHQELKTDKLMSVTVQKSTSSVPTVKSKPKSSNRI